MTARGFKVERSLTWRTRRVADLINPVEPTAYELSVGKATSFVALPAAPAFAASAADSESVSSIGGLRVRMKDDDEFAEDLGA